MKPFSFIHAADLHLGSPFKGVGSRLPAAGEELGAATYEAFLALVDLCIEKSVDFLMVAGDVFDLSDRSLRAQLAFRDGLARLSDAGIRSFTVLGNHDPWEAWSNRINWPEKAHLFPPDQVETIPVSIGNSPVATVSGISYRTHRQAEDLSAGFQAENPDLYQIALLHSNCGNNPDHGVYAPCSLDSLRTSGFDYWALGHVHEQKILETRPYIVYPGCLQGLSIRESGEHGCWLVNVSASRQATLSFQPLDKLRWRTAEIDIGGLETLDDLDRTISDTLSRQSDEGAGRPVIIRIRLSGRGDLYQPLRQISVTEELLERFRETGSLHSPPVWVQDLEIDCRPEVDLEKRGAMDDLLGQILRGAGELRASPDTLSERLMPALSDVYQNPRLARYLCPPSPSELKALLQDAALICFDQLESEP